MPIYCAILFTFCREKEDTMRIGGRLGFMRFGSRIDLTIPLNVNLDIKIGQKVVGNRTVIGTY